MHHLKPTKYELHVFNFGVTSELKCMSEVLVLYQSNNVKVFLKWIRF